jgi:hypothetical protein
MSLSFCCGTFHYLHKITFRPASVLVLYQVTKRMRIVTLKLFHMQPSFRMRNQTDEPRSIGGDTSRLAQIGIMWEASESSGSEIRPDPLRFRLLTVCS